MEQNRALLVLIILIFFFFPDTSSPDHRKRIAQERYNLQVLQKSTFGHPGNVTGLLSPLSRNGSLASPVLTPPQVVREQWRTIREDLLGRYSVAEQEQRTSESTTAQELSAYSSHRLKIRRDLPVYQNATGHALGDWTKLPFDEALPTTALPNITYPANLTKISGGKLFLVFEEVGNDDSHGQALAQVKMSLRIRDADGKQEAAANLNGIHFMETGEMVAATSSERFAGFFAVPHFTVYETEFNQTKAVLVPSIEKAMEKMEETRDLEAPWIPSGGSTSVPQCEYIVYSQLHPVDSEFDGKYEALEGLRAIEREMRFPTGIPLPSPPVLRVTAMIYSPNCGFVLVADLLEGKTLWSLYNEASHVALGAASLAAAQAWVLIRQVNEANTLSTISRVSFWTITVMVVVDGYCFFMFMAASVLFGAACFLPIVTVSFGYLMLFAVLGMRFLFTIYRVQRQSEPASVAAPVTRGPSVPSGGLPLPASAEPQAPVVFSSPTQAPAATDEEVHSELSVIHVKVYFVLVGMFFLSLYVATWPPFSRDLMVHFFLLIVNSYWIPQVYRNVMRGCRKALQWEFVFGMSVLRLLPVFYSYLYPKNIFGVDPKPEAVAIIAGWVWIQCLALVCQDMLGPRLLIPSRLLPVVYDYHSALPVEDEEAARDTGIPADDGRVRRFPCVVCMQPVEVPATRTGGGRSGGEPRAMGLLGRKSYMVTPCKHVFHPDCLEGWMRFRLQCPICRNSLPAL